LDWFPRMQAMSLSDTEADSEQNELRTLQTQLQKTNQLVATLSTQLHELREQVSTHVPELSISISVCVRACVHACVRVSVCVCEPMPSNITNAFAKQVTEQIYKNT